MARGMRVPVPGAVYFARDIAEAFMQRKAGGSTRYSSNAV